MKRLVLVFLLLSTLGIAAIAQENSVLATGNWYKVAVEKTGVYKITPQFLADIGIDLTNIDPRKIKIYGNKGGMLPQANDASRPLDLVENAILVQGESDGSFDSNDAIIFYAEGPDAYSYLNAELIYEFNIYDRANYYFITVDGEKGKRIQPLPNEGTGFNVINTFNDFHYHEATLTNLLISGREWYGEKFDLTTEYTFNIDFPEITSGSTIKVTSNVMAQSFAPSTFDLQLNGIKIGEQTVESVPDFRQNVYRYSVKGKEKTDVFSVNTSTLGNTESLSLKYTYHKSGSGQSIGYLDNFLVEVERNLRWTGNAFTFRSLKSLDNPNSTFVIGNSNNQLSVWNITEIHQPREQQFSLLGNQIKFGVATSTLQEFVIFDPASLPAPQFKNKVPNQNIRAYSSPDLLIISHSDFLSEAHRLANFRQSDDGLTTKVVAVNQVYNEFSSGRQDVTALRDYVKHLYDKGSNLKYVLLFGRGSYDYLNVLPNNTNFVPIYESRNSLHPLDTYGSDDYYAFLEDNEGMWEENSATDHTLDVGVGRIPAITSTEAKAVVDKLIYYSTEKENLGSWRNVVTFVADDGDFNLHQRQSDQLTKLVDTTYAPFNPDKLFLDNFEQISRPGGEISPAASEALNEAVNKGALIVNFTGHGGETGWMQEQVLNTVMIRGWENKNRLPLFVTATCEFSRHDDPRRISGGELIITNPIGGGIGIVSTCRPVSSSSNFELNKAFYNSVFEVNNGEYLRLGDIIRLTKNNPAVNRVGNRNFALLGDPSLRLSYPEKDISITSIKNGSVESDTINALSHVTISGEVRENGVIDGMFEGTLSAVIYDKESSLTTRGNESSPFNYYDKENIIFKGKASIKNGLFSFDFIVPKNISYQLDQGKISLYATHKSKIEDANGAIFVTIGGSNKTPDNDTSGPDIKLFLGDSLNQNLNNIASNTTLLAQLRDQSGINISGYGVGNSLMAILDDSIQYNLNSFYVADADTYQRGWVNFPLRNLSKGKHSIKLRAWDTYNNSAEKSINFFVLDPNTLHISELFNFPNPFSTATTFVFKHNRAEDDLEVTLEIINAMSGSVRKLEFELENSSSTVLLPKWEGTNSFGQKLNAGIYLFTLSVRSKKDGANAQRQQRLVLIN